MVWRAIILWLFILSISSCAVRSSVPPRMSMMDIYADSIGDSQQDVARYMRENLKEQKTFGYVKPYIPVMISPVVRKVWVPDHKSNNDGSVLVAGHWVYVMVQGPRWFIEEEGKKMDVPVIIPGRRENGS